MRKKRSVGETRGKVGAADGNPESPVRRDMEYCVWRVRSNAKRNINEMTVPTITRIKYKQKHKRTAAKREQIREKCGGRIVP